ncbi:hypothetical protein KI387_034444 [Taxus chinensis]|uniref:TIR domain-containing protein n=1 Tax=Taxus chinensis TaxID=29808 RepID=A0AA38BXX5_TAXCH|nr:hypothetical protein KI387_034444 [Taxus chinensis]
MDFTSFRPSPSKVHFSAYKYHVFLSFRGPDVRKSLVDHLFEALTTSGIHVFLDTERLEKGEIIGLSLEKAIESSAILIPIFSRTYADSVWCLEEVRQMWKCRSTQLIIPLFYDVDPSDVRYPQKHNGRYAEAFNRHYSKGRYDTHIIGEWKDALQHVSSLSGWSLQLFSGYCFFFISVKRSRDFLELFRHLTITVFGICRYEGKLVKRVVLDVIASINCVSRHVAKHPVGITHHVSKVKDMLDLDLNDRAITLGIWGIGGIGKTTLAKALFNQLSICFEASSFLSDVRSSAQQPGGLVQLQKQLLKDLAKVDIPVNDIDHGKSLIQFHLGSLRSLVILDDIDHRRQLDSFMLDCYGPGSRVIVTTRDKHVLNACQPQNIYKLEGLQVDEALELFSWHAFLKPHPDDPYQDLSRKIVMASHGVPLTLEVLGAELYDKKNGDNCWIEALSVLQKMTHPNIFEPLKISYDSLRPCEREIFLDIACIFIGQDIEEPTIFWAELGLDVYIALENLQSKLLIRIGDDNKVLMHDLMRDMGRAIVAAESHDHPGKRSRLWKQEDVHKVIDGEWGTKSVKYLLHTLEDEDEGDRLNTKSLASMNGLRYLCFSNTIMDGCTINLSPNLKWLKWKRCSLERMPPHWNLEHLAILDLSSRSISHGSNLQYSLKELWNDRSHRKMPRNLKILRANWCPNLQRIPTFWRQPSLLKLDLTGCSMITELPDSLGFQVQLNYLELACCSRLEKLPDCIGNLLELKHLGLSECSSLKALPDSIGFLEALTHLNLFHCHKLERLPGSITELTSLEKLVLSSCSKLNKLPDTLEDLESLRELELNHVFLNDLPYSIWYVIFTETGRTVKLSSYFACLCWSSQTAALPQFE